MRRAILALLCAGMASAAAAQMPQTAAQQQCFSILGDGSETTICFDADRSPPRTSGWIEGVLPPRPKPSGISRDGSDTLQGSAGDGAFMGPTGPIIDGLGDGGGRGGSYQPQSNGGPSPFDPVGGGAPPASKADAHLPLQPVRALIAPSEMPPAGVAAYGMVAFPALPLPADRERFEAVCQSFRATLLAPAQVASTPVSAQMITFWPVRDRAGLPDDPPCETMIDRYDLKAGLDAIRDADTRKDGLAARRGPFLIAWSPSASRAKPDAVILVIDMSAMSSAKSFQEVFVQWRQKIIDDPKFWRGGFSLETIRLALRDALDAYGARLTPLFSSGK